MTIKKVKVEQLRSGMYIHDLNCRWMKHTFLFNKFLLKGEDKIKKISRLGIREVFIDISKGADVEEVKAKEEAEAEALANIIETANKKEAPAFATEFKEELVNARQIHKDAGNIVHDIMNDIRLGKQVDIEKAEPVVEQITESIFRNDNALIILSRVKQKDNYTFQHSVSVCALLVSFLRSLGYHEDEIREAGIGALLHDIGKMRIPENILNKPGRLTNEEYEIMKTHVVEGLKLLNNNSRISKGAIQIVSQHHERFDGTGYPDRLKENQISRFGQMAAIVDVYDAITSNRVYRNPMQPIEALKNLSEWSKNHFNPTLVQHFILTIGVYPIGSLVRLESEKLAVVCRQSDEDMRYPTVRVMYDLKTESNITPEYVDLSKPLASGARDRIVGHEAPQTWRIDPYIYL